MKEQPIVSHRNHFTCLDDIVDWQMALLLRGWPDLPADRAEGLRKFLRMFGESLLRQVHMDLEKAASRGIEQAITIITDPAYFEKQEVRRKRERQESAKQAAETRRQNQIRKVAGPSEEETQAKRRRLYYDIQMYQRFLDKSRQELRELDTQHPATQATSAGCVQ